MAAIPDMTQAKRAIRDRALAAGFDAVGFAPAALAANAKSRLAAFIAEGMHGDMGWLADTAPRRADPRDLWPDARSVITLAMNYGPSGDPFTVVGQRECGAISVYAQGHDYHDVIKKRLRTLARWIDDTWRGDVKVFVDTAPVMEKPLAERGAIGWQGKHTNLVSRRFGSWLFLAEIFTTLKFEPDAPEVDHCGECRRCLEVCPTAAFPAPYRLDARRCISYLTIEHKGHIGREFRAAIGNRIYGCDDCLAVCPWNKFATRATEAELAPRAELLAPRLADLARLDDAGFRQLFAGSPIKRTGRDRFVRNVLIAIGNSGLAELAQVARERVDDASPLVRAMAAWALSRLLARPQFEALRTARLEVESDADVRREWTEAEQA